MNVNDFVWVRLNELGWKVFDDYYRAHGVDPAGVRSHLVDGPGGWQRFQLHELMHIFGPVSYNGASIVFDRNVVLTEQP